MKRLLVRLGVALALIAGLTMAAPAADATLYYSYPNGGGWYYSGYIHNGWTYWRPVDVYDDSTNTLWSNSKEFWTEWSYGGVSHARVWGPILAEYNNQGAEWSRLGQPTNEPFYSHWDGQGPVYQQNYYNGVIRWHSRVCRCYYWGGFAEVFLYS